METYIKKRLEIIVEAPALDQLLDALDQVGATGYTVVPALAGRGREGRWSRAGQISDAGRMVMVICIVSPQIAEAALDAAYEVVARQIGIVSQTEVDVIRDDHF